MHIAKLYAFDPYMLERCGALRCPDLRPPAVSRAVQRLPAPSRALSCLAPLRKLTIAACLFEAGVRPWYYANHHRLLMLDGIARYNILYMCVYAAMFTIL